MVQMTRFEQRLARNAADPQTRPAKLVVLVDTRYVESKLCGSNRRYITTRTTAQNH